MWRLGHEGVAQHIGAGLDLSAVLPTSGKVGSQVAANLGVNGYYHFLSGSTFDPFLTAGYAGMYRDFAANGFNGGGGMNWWFGGGSVGGVVEVRELVFGRSPSLAATHYTEFRFGVAFRSK